MSRPIWFVDLLKTAFLGRFLLAKTTRIFPFGSIADDLLFEGDELYYLPKGTIIPVNAEIVNEGDYVLPDQIVDHFIDEARSLWIMDSCICRDANSCEDYPQSIGCLFLGEATSKINPELGKPVSKEEAHAHVKNARKAGLVHLVGRNKLDTIWLGVGPGRQLLTICNCCPCCCLWRMLPDLTPKIGSKVQCMPGIRVRVTDDCSACGICLDSVCFVEAIEMKDGRAFISERCRGCGRCIEACPEGAIEMEITENDYVQSLMDRISTLVDLD